MLEKLDDETLAQINIILKHNDKYLIFNLKKIKDLMLKISSIIDLLIS